jgi:predicted kinase
VSRPKLFVLVGLPAAGKTTLAKELETTEQAIRLSPDEWMIPLFGDSGADGKRDLLEGRFLWLALQILERGGNVILDFGCWSRDERSALRSLAASVGASCQILYLEVDPAEQRRRIRRRWATSPTSTFPLSDADLDQFRAIFEIPDHAELVASEVDPTPGGYETWRAWAADRWPTSIGSGSEAV